MKPTIAIFLHQPKCSVQSGNGIMKALSDAYRFKIFTKHDLENDFFNDVDMVCVPGGIGDADSFDYLMRENLPRIRDFVINGGKYLGICMGAYWAGSRYFDLLDDVDATQYIKREGATTRRSYGTTESVLWNNKLEDMFFYDGCSLVGDETKFRTIARYVNNDPMAIIQGNIGVIGCHPESLDYWYEKKYMRNRWHKGRHHELLLGFVDELTR